MKEIKVTDQKCTDPGEKVSKQLHREGPIPCNLYSKARQDSKPVTFSFTALMPELRKLVYTLHIYVVGLIIDGEKRTAVFKEFQFRPVTDVLPRTGFYEVNDQKLIVMGIPVRPIGLAQDVRDGGRMNMPIRKINVKAPHQQISERLDINVIEPRLGKSIKAGKLSSESLELVTPKEIVVCSIRATRDSIRAMQIAAATGAE